MITANNQHIHLKKKILIMFQRFEKNVRMPKPDCCTDDIYHIMTDCWDSDPFIRKKPQATLRDLRQIWLQSNLYLYYLNILGYFRIMITNFQL